ncbi:MAG TPA: aldehyde dehydrogenase (NADP(+)) [Armatimonadota bacterium]|jgi:NADP-dependent aldehyde dehydrogenase
METRDSLTGRHLIAGEWVTADGGRVRAVNPVTAEPLNPAFCQATELQVDAALRAAADAAAQTRGLPGADWAALLDDIADRIEALGDTLMIRANEETALPLARLESERARTCFQLRLYGQEAREGSWVDAVIDHGDPARQPLPKPDVRRMLRPLGPVVVFDASNFPFAYGGCGGDTASALAAGNPVIVKAHPGHPGTDELFAEVVLAAIRAAGLPPGLFGMLQGATAESGSALVRHPLTEAVGFTGSLRGGRALFDIASSRPRPIPVYAEMGSLNPLVVLPGALAERGDAIADGLSQSITGGVGQFCTKPGLVLVIEGPDTERFIQGLKARMAAIPAGTMLNSAIQTGFRKVTQGFPGVAGVKVHLEPSCSGYTDATPGLFEVDASTFIARPELREEAFGPAALVVRCRDLAGLLDSIAAASGQLTGTVHAGASDDLKVVAAVADALERGVGRLVYNGYPTGLEVCRAMMHGGPYPATTAPATTSVGTSALVRFARPVAFQNTPDALLPPALREANPLGIRRMVDGVLIA